MRKIKFIQKLVDEERIELVEESEEICQSYNQKSENSLKAARILLKQNLVEESTSMSYYAMFHKTIALFRKVGIKCENHTATIILLEELFSIDNKDLHFAKEERIDKQYYTNFTVTKQDTEDLLKKAEQFVEKLDLCIDQLTKRRRKEIQETFKKTYV